MRCSPDIVPCLLTVAGRVLPQSRLCTDWRWCLWPDYDFCQFLKRGGCQQQPEYRLANKRYVDAPATDHWQQASWRAVGGRWLWGLPPEANMDRQRHAL
jgi:hypothetical protein